MFMQSYFCPFFNFSPKSKIFIYINEIFAWNALENLSLLYPPIFKKSGGHHTEVRLENYVHKIKKLVLFLDHVLDMCWFL